MAFYFVDGLDVNMIFLSGLSFYTTDNGLLEAFSQYGQVVEGALSLRISYIQLYCPRAFLMTFSALNIS